jgi:hypothetical protein
LVLFPHLFPLSAIAPSLSSPSCCICSLCFFFPSCIVRCTYPYIHTHSRGTKTGLPRPANCGAHSVLFCCYPIIHSIFFFLPRLWWSGLILNIPGSHTIPDCPFPLTKPTRKIKQEETRGNRRPQPSRVHLTCLLDPLSRSRPRASIFFSFLPSSTHSPASSPEETKLRVSC